MDIETTVLATSPGRIATIHKQNGNTRGKAWKMMSFPLQDLFLHSAAALHL